MSDKEPPPSLAPAQAKDQPPMLDPLFEASPLGMLRGCLDAAGYPVITQVNPAFIAITGVPASEALGLAPDALLLKPLHATLWKRVCLDLSHGKPFADTLRCSRADGSLFWARIHLYPAGSPASLWCLLLEDVDEAQEHALRLQHSEEQFRALVANSRDMIFMLRPDGTCTYASPALEPSLGLAPDSVVSQAFQSLLPEEDHPQFRRLLARQLDRQPEHLLIHRLRRADGSLLWCETTMRAVWGLDDSQPATLIATTRDISRRRAAERELQEMHLLLSSVFDSVPLGLCITSSTGRVIQANEGFARPLGYAPSELCGRLIDNVLPAELLTPGSRDGSAERASGETFPVHVSVTVLSKGADGSSLVTLADQSERLSIEGRLREAQRLESLGTLAGGVAHDFNNLLAIILGYASLLRGSAPDNERVGEYAETILEAGRRGADVVRQLMLYANQHEPLLVDTDLHALLANAVVQAAEGWPERIRLESDYLARSPRMPLDADQLGRVLEHLLRNAREAIPGQGTICIRTADRPPQAGDTTNPAGWIELSVIDDGCGMDESVRARMFEPFFSRNKGPEVRGLGLAIVYGIVKAHRGRIEVESAPGRGTRVSILLPRPAIPASGLPAPDTYQPSNYTLRSGACVLLVEDEPDIGRLWHDLLTREGWTVHWARDGAQAVALYDLHREALHIVFSDIGLPGDIDGWQLAERFRADRPSLPIVLASGWFQRGGSTRPAISGPVALIDKPYQVREVLARLYQMLQPVG